MRNFKKLLIWQLGMEIVDRTYEIIKEIPESEKFGIKSQMTRSATAIPSNIAEGSAKRSQKDYLRYVEIALGSSFELETHALIVERRRWVEEKCLRNFLMMIEKEQKMLTKFIEKL